MGEAEDRAELVRKLKALAAKKGLTSEELFRAYDGDGDEALDRGELVELLAAADVGNGWTRSTWVARLLERLDRDQSSSLTWPEIKAAIEAGDPAPPPASGTAPTLSRADAATIARRLLETDDPVDLSSFNAADLALIEEESVKLAGQPPPIPRAPEPILRTDYVNVGALIGLAAVVGLALVLARRA